MKKLCKALAIASIAFITSCASVAPTTETYTGYRIYHVSSDYNLTQVRDAVLNAAKELNNNAQITNGIPPYPLPEKPGRFQIKDMAFGPVTMQFPQTPGATISVRSSNDNGSAEKMNWVAGVYPYKDGYSIQIVMTASYQRGTSDIFNPVALGAAMGREAAYNQQGGLEGRIKGWFDGFTSKIDSKVKMKLEESYPQS